MSLGAPALKPPRGEQVEVCLHGGHSQSHLSPQGCLLISFLEVYVDRLKLQMEVPHGDVFIHAGDFTRCGSMQEVQN